MRYTNISYIFTFLVDFVKGVNKDLSSKKFYFLSIFKGSGFTEQFL